MTVRLAMYENSLAHIGEQLHPLGLDLEILTFNKDGKFHGGNVPASEIEADYLWFSQHLSSEGLLPMGFQVALEMKSLDVLQTFNAGLDAPAYSQIAAKGIRICNSSAQGIAIAEYTMAQVLSLTHPIQLQREQQAERTWKITPFRELSRMKWLIFGYGPIGSAVAERAKVFGSHISVIRRSPATDAFIDRAGVAADAKTFAAEADVILLACSLNEQTRGMINQDFLDAVKPGAILVNIARGGVIEDAALIRAMDKGIISTAVLDVFHTEPLPVEDPLWSHPKVRLTPHTSFGGDGVRPRWDALFLDNIQRYARGEPLAREVNPAEL
jgi:phosphoglycerate dehydrogenase-like enzyme